MLKKSSCSHNTCIIPNFILEEELLESLWCSSDLEMSAASTSSSNKMDRSGTCDSFWAKDKSVRSASARFSRHMS